MIEQSGIKYNKQFLEKGLYSGNLKHYQFYNVDFDLPAYAFHAFKKKNFPNISYISKQLNKTYFDIEVFIEEGVFPDAELAERPINSIATYNNMTNTATAYYLKSVCVLENSRMVTFTPLINDEEEVKKIVLKEYEELCIQDPNYKINDLKIEIHGFDNEIALLTKFFQDRIQERTLFLIGFNSNLFDNPYIFTRLINLVGIQEAQLIVSEFGEFTSNGKFFRLSDYILADLLEMYKPVDQGGGGFGRSLPDYKLKSILKKEVKIDKLDLPGGFNENYINNLPGFILYNIIDTVPIFKLDSKLSFLESQWSLNSHNNSIMSATMGGRSLMYTYRNNLHYTMQNQLLRYTKLNNEIFYNLN